MDVTDDPTLRLLERHANGEIDRNVLIEEIAGADPRLALMARLMARDADEGSDDGSSLERLESEIGIDDAVRMSEEARQLADDVRRQFEEVVSEIGELRERLDSLAAALGACPGCWGDDPSCRWCRGRGVPGALVPDRAAFDRLVLPAVRVQAGIHRARRQPISGPDDRTETHERRTA